MGNPPQTPVWFPGLLGQSGQGTDSLRRLSVTPAPGGGGGGQGSRPGVCEHLCPGEPSGKHLGRGGDPVQGVGAHAHTPARRAPHVPVHT